MLSLVDCSFQDLLEPGELRLVCCRKPRAKATAQGGLILCLLLSRPDGYVTQMARNLPASFLLPLLLESPRPQTVQAKRDLMSPPKSRADYLTL
jgi:hypothetical protein